MMRFLHIMLLGSILALWIWAVNSHVERLKNIVNPPKQGENND